MSEKSARSVSYAAGAIAAPMLFASVMPRSTILPMAACVTAGPFPSFDRMQQPAAVAVHWAVGVRCEP